MVAGGKTFPQCSHGYPFGADGWPTLSTQAAVRSSSSSALVAACFFLALLLFFRRWKIWRRGCSIGAVPGGGLDDRSTTGSARKLWSMSVQSLVDEETGDGILADVGDGGLGRRLCSYTRGLATASGAGEAGLDVGHDGGILLGVVLDDSWLLRSIEGGLLGSSTSCAGATCVSTDASLRTKL